MGYYGLIWVNHGFCYTNGNYSTKKHGYYNFTIIKPWLIFFGYWLVTGKHKNSLPLSWCYHFPLVCFFHHSPYSYLLHFCEFCLSLNHGSQTTLLIIAFGALMTLFTNLYWVPSISSLSPQSHSLTPFSLCTFPSSQDPVSRQSNQRETSNT